MASRKRRRYTDKFKAKVLAELKEGKIPATHIFQKYGISNSVAYSWKAASEGDTSYGTKRKNPGGRGKRRIIAGDSIGHAANTARSLLKSARDAFIEDRSGKGTQSEGELLTLLALSTLERATS